MSEYNKDLEDRCDELEHKLSLFSNINDVIKLTVKRRWKKNHNNVREIFTYDISIMLVSLDVGIPAQIVGRVSRDHGFWKFQAGYKSYNLACFGEDSILKKALELIGMQMLDYSIQDVDHDAGAAETTKG
jgi:hypothetical protein